jgi:L-histidine Nalpha-methyltransferase
VPPQPTPLVDNAPEKIPPSPQPEIREAGDGIDPVADFARATVAGMEREPRRMECRFLYDEMGSWLYRRITQQPEYYLTRTESSILEAYAEDIREITGPATLVELGSGEAEKTRHLLKAWQSRGCAQYIPVDVSRAALDWACESLGGSFPGLRIRAIHGDYSAALQVIRSESPVLLTFLGSTIGNFDTDELGRFLGDFAAALTEEDWFLLGVDLEKDTETVEAAYNDEAGVTASFTRNLFARMNLELESGIDLSCVRHMARYERERGRVEIHARFTREQTLHVAPLKRSFRIAAGEEILTEISRKFRMEELVPLLAQHRLEPVRIYTDPRNWYALLLLQKVSERPHLLS